jgi:tetratricopeptide (TPR) repeat protein
LVATDDRVAYRDICQKAIKQFGVSLDPRVTDKIAKICLILPSSDMDLGSAAWLAEIAVKFGRSDQLFAYFQCTKGLAEYRQGHFQNAVEWLRKALDFGDPSEGQNMDSHVRSMAYATLAMAHYRLGQASDAATMLTKARDVAGTLPRVEKGNLGPLWADWIIAQVLMDEAAALIDTGENPLRAE